MITYQLQVDVSKVLPSRPCCLYMISSPSLSNELLLTIRQFLICLFLARMLIEDFFFENMVSDLSNQLLKIYK